MGNHAASELRENDRHFSIRLGSRVLVGADGGDVGIDPRSNMPAGNIWYSTMLLFPRDDWHLRRIVLEAYKAAFALSGSAFGFIERSFTATSRFFARRF